MTRSKYEGMQVSEAMQAASERTELIRKAGACGSYYRNLPEATSAETIRQHESPPHLGEPKQSFLFLLLTVFAVLAVVLTAKPRRDYAIAEGPIGRDVLQLSAANASKSTVCPRRALLLLRHAKASWDDPDLDDFDRPLADEGRKDALRLGRYLFIQNTEPPNVIYSSPSKRTQETLALVRRDGWAENVPVILDERLYNFTVLQASEDPYFEFVSGLKARYHRVMIVGHNPQIGALARILLPKEDGLAFSNFSPSTFCEISLTKLEAWYMIKGENGRLGLLLRPKLFPL